MILETIIRRIDSLGNSVAAETSLSLAKEILDLSQELFRKGTHFTIKSQCELCQGRIFEDDLERVNLLRFYAYNHTCTSCVEFFNTATGENLADIYNARFNLQVAETLRVTEANKAEVQKALNEVLSGNSVDFLNGVFASTNREVDVGLLGVSPADPSSAKIEGAL